MSFLATFMVIDHLILPEISFFLNLAVTLKLWNAREIKNFPLQSPFYVVFHYLLLMHHHLEINFKLTTHFQPNLLTSSLLPNSRQLDRLGCRHWIFRGWPHPYRDWLFLWGDGPSDRRWGGRTWRNPCTGKTEVAPSSDTDPEDKIEEQQI